MGFTRNVSRDQGILADLLDRLGLPIGLVSPLMAHAEAVADSSERLGLVSQRDRASVVRRHTADSLLFAAARRPQPGEVWVDVGSGAGFPGLVLACCFPATRFTLIEPNQRKAGFLELEIAELGIRNATVDPRRLEKVDATFDVAVARALKDPSQAVRSLGSHLRPGGVALVATGPHVAAQEGIDIVRLEGFGDVDSPGVLLKMGPAG